MSYKRQYVKDDRPKEFAWSYSRLKNYETCPLKYYTVDVLKQAKEETTALDEGNRLHDAMKKRVQSNVQLPREFTYMERWAVDLTKVIHPLQIIQCELELAATRDLKPAGWFDRMVHMRAKIDYLLLVPSKAEGKFVCKIVDYKTGRPQDDDTQLMVNAALVFINYRDVDSIWSEFLYCKYGDTRHYKYTRENIRPLWNELQPRVAALETATVNTDFPPKPCGLCKNYCPVSDCEYNGENE